MKLFTFNVLQLYFFLCSSKTLRDMIEELSKQNTNDATGSTAAPADQSEEANLNQRLIGVSNNLLGNENNIADQNATGSSVAVLRPWV